MKTEEIERVMSKVLKRIEQCLDNNGSTDYLMALQSTYATLVGARSRPPREDRSAA